jgi:hypothetical protein
MIDVDVFYKSFGATRAMGQDDQLIVSDGVRIHCEPNQWTALFESSLQTEQNLLQVFSCARQDVHLIPFSTRSGWLGMRSPSPSATDETSQAVSRLEQVLNTMGVNTASR